MSGEDKNHTQAILERIKTEKNQSNRAELIHRLWKTTVTMLLKRTTGEK